MKRSDFVRSLMLLPAAALASEVEAEATETEKPDVQEPEPRGGVAFTGVSTVTSTGWVNHPQNRLGYTVSRELWDEWHEAAR